MICALVLGAGESRRMGTQKLLLPWAGKTVIEHIVGQLLASRVDQVCVVTGHDHEQLQLTLTDYPVTVAYNDQHTQGMLSSVRCGLKALPENCTGVLVALGDQPALTTGTVNLLVDQLTQYRQIVLPVYQGTRGHPLLFSSLYVPEILTHYDAKGLRGLLQKHEQDVREVPVNSPEVLWDIDTPDDYREQIESADE
jgi:molybdenum cofactor cytidylyltransferase